MYIDAKGVMNMSFYLDMQIDTSNAQAKLQRLLDKFPEAPQIVQEDFEVAMDNLIDIAVSICPVETGNLASSIQVLGDFPSFEFVADAVNKDGEYYGGYVEYGTSKMAAEPFMWPAIEAVMIDLYPTMRMHLIDYFANE